MYGRGGLFLFRDPLFPCVLYPLRMLDISQERSEKSVSVTDYKKMLLRGGGKMQSCAGGGIFDFLKKLSFK